MNSDLVPGTTFCRVFCPSGAMVALDQATVAQFRKSDGQIESNMSVNAEIFGAGVVATDRRAGAEYNVAANLMNFSYTVSAYCESYNSGDNFLPN